MLIKNTHVVPVWAEDGVFTLEAEFLLHVKSEGDSTLCNQHLYLEMWRLFSADIRFDPNIPLPGSYDSLIPVRWSCRIS